VHPPHGPGRQACSRPHHSLYLNLLISHTIVPWVYGIPYVARVVLMASHQIEDRATVPLVILAAR